MEKLKLKIMDIIFLISKKFKSSLYKNLDVYFLVKENSLNKHTNQFKEALDNMLRSFKKKKFWLVLMKPINLLKYSMQFCCL